MKTQKQKQKKAASAKEALRTPTPTELGQVAGGYRHTRHCSHYCSCCWGCR